MKLLRKIMKLVLLVALIIANIVLLYNNIHQDKLIFTENFSSSYIDRQTTSLEEPVSIVAVENKLYICDLKKHSIVILDNYGDYLMEKGKFGSKPGEFITPIAIDFFNNHFYVLDHDNARIQIFDSNFEYESEIDITKVSTYINNKFSYNNIMVGPEGIYLSSKSNISRTIPSVLLIKTDGNIIVKKNNVYGSFIRYDNGSMFIKTGDSDSLKYKLTKNIYSKPIKFILSGSKNNCEINTKLSYGVMKNYKEQIIGLRPNGSCLDFYTQLGYQYSYSLIKNNTEWDIESLVASSYEMATDHKNIYIVNDNGGLIIIREK